MDNAIKPSSNPRFLIRNVRVPNLRQTVMNARPVNTQLVITAGMAAGGMGNMILACGLCGHQHLNRLIKKNHQT